MLTSSVPERVNHPISDRFKRPKQKLCSVQDRFFYLGGIAFRAAPIQIGIFTGVLVTVLHLQKGYYHLPLIYGKTISI